MIRVQKEPTMTSFPLVNNAELGSHFLADLTQLPPDPLLGLTARYQQDKNPNKVDLGVGVYRDKQGHSPVMQAVKQAEARYLVKENSKAYTAPRGNDGFINGVERLLWGENHQVLSSARVASLQTPGGSCALRLAADFILRCHPQASLWLPTPSWINHTPLMGSSGLPLKAYPYYDSNSHQLTINAMLDQLKKVPAGDVVLFHGCCHNPTGADLCLADWQAIQALASEQGFIPLIDMAYQGFAEGLEGDAAGLRLLTEHLPVVLVTASCSKNFAIYRERAGLFSVVTNSAAEAQICLSQALDIVGRYYFVPPSHGAAVTSIILQDATLEALWRQELDSIRQRIADVRQTFDQAIKGTELAAHFSHIAQQRGMFSFLGIDPSAVDQLRRDYSIYMADSSRINLSGINPDNMDYLLAALTKTLT